MQAGDPVVRLGLDDVLTWQDKRSASLPLTLPINKSRKHQELTGRMEVEVME